MYQVPNTSTLTYAPQTKPERVVKSVVVDEYFENGELVSKTTTVEYEDRQVPYTPTWTNGQTIDINFEGNAADKALKDIKSAGRSTGPHVHFDKSDGGTVE